MRTNAFFKNIIKNNAKSMLTKIFLVCISLSFLILSLSGLYNYYFIQKNYSAEIERFEQNKLAETLNNLDIFFNEMKKLAVNYTLNPDIFRHVYMPLDSIVDEYPDIQKLQVSFDGNINSSSYLKNIFVYSEKNDRILDFQRLTPADSYYDRAWMDAYKKMTGNFCVVDTHKVISSSDHEGTSPENVITLITKLPYIGTNKDGAIILDIDSAIIADLLKTVTADNNNNISFMTSDNNVIISSNNTNYLYKNISEIIHTSNIQTGQKEGKFNISLNGIAMIAYFKTSDINNWKLYYISPESTVFKKSDIAKNVTILICLLLFILVLILSFLFSFKVYNPVKVLLTNIKSNLKINYANSQDIKIIQNGVNFLLENKRMLEDQLSQNKLLAKEAFVSQLITGDFLSLNEINNKAGYFDIKLDYAYFKVVVIKNSMPFLNPSNNDHELTRISMVNIIKTTFEKSDIEILYSNDRSANLAVLLMFNISQNVLEVEVNIEQILEDIKETIEKALNENFTIGLGRTYKDALNIGTSYREAIEALNFKFLKGDNAVINIDEMSSKAIYMHYPVDKEQKLISLISLNDYDKSLLCLKEMISEIMLYNSKFEYIEICLSNIISIIQRYIFEFGLNAKEVFGDEYSIYSELNQFENIDIYTGWVSDKINKIIEYQLSVKNDALSDFPTYAKEFIDKNYTEELSLQSVADHFNYSPQYFCKIFKEKIGINFLDYLTKTRMEKAKILLRDTDESVERIASLVGYNNRFSFIRSFKIFTSFSPAEYRLRCKK